MLFFRGVFWSTHFKIREDVSVKYKSIENIHIVIFVGERLIQFATENLVTEVLIHPQVDIRSFSFFYF